VSCNRLSYTVQYMHATVSHVRGSMATQTIGRTSRRRNVRSLSDKRGSCQVETSWIHSRWCCTESVHRQTHRTPVATDCCCNCLFHTAHNIRTSTAYDKKATFPLNMRRNGYLASLRQKRWLYHSIWWPLFLFCFESYRGKYLHHWRTFTACVLSRHVILWPWLWSLWLWLLIMHLVSHTIFEHPKILGFESSFPLLVTWHHQEP